MRILPPDEEKQGKARIKVAGIGGGGSNAVTYMMQKEIEGAYTIAANTDRQALEKAIAHEKIQLGEKLTRGLGAGGNPEIGRKAMEESIEAFSHAVENSDMVFLTAGMGGGTGTGGIPIAAQVTRELEALTVAVVTKPFSFEGPRRMAKAEEGIRQLKSHVDTLLVISNDRLLQITDKKTSIMSAFALVNDVLYRAVKSIIDIILRPGLVNVDFADVRSIMLAGGDAIMGTGEASGDDRAKEAAKKAISSPLLDGASIQGARGILINVVGGEDLSLHEVQEATQIIYDEASKGGYDPEVIMGMVIDPEMEGKIQVNLIATGIGMSKSKVISTIKSSRGEGEAEDIREPAYKRKKGKDTLFGPGSGRRF